MKLSDNVKGRLYLYGPFVAVYLLFLILAPGFTLFVTKGIGVLILLYLLVLAVMISFVKGAKMVSRANPGKKFWWD